MSRPRSFIYFFITVFCFISCSKEPIPSINSIINDSPEQSEAQKYVPKKLFHLSSFRIEPFSKNAQGMDIYNDSILFQTGVDQNSIHIINLNNSKVLGTLFFKTPSYAYCHMNNINCGEKYDSNDYFPLLYLSQTFESRACFVLRIANDANSYSNIQTITYKGDKHYMKNCDFDWFIDVPNNIIYTYGQYNGDVNKREIMKFPLPSLDEEVISYTDDDILDSFVLENQSIYQGSKIINGLLYAPVGYGNAQYPGRLIIIDLHKKEVVKDIPISIGEPEAIAKYKTGAILSSGGRDPNYYFIAI